MLLAIFSCTALYAADDMDYSARTRELVQPLIDNEMLVGLSTALYKDGKIYYVGAGRTSLDGDGVNPDENTFYEIGSISKVFTSLLLSDMTLSGSLKLDDTAAQYLPAGVTMPSFEGEPIRLLHLAQHSSGLPRMPDNFKPQDAANPYADYMNEQLYEFLNAYKLPRKPGTVFEYSNLGAGLLGHILELVSKKDYETLLKERITSPLGMQSTKITLSPADFKRLARPYGPDCRLNRNWDLGALKGAGGIRSTAADMLSFAVAAMQSGDAPLAAVFSESMRHERETSAADTRIALGWHIKKNKAGDNLYWHNGGTGGYHSFMMLNLNKKLAVVALSNTGSDLVDKVGAQLMRLLETGEIDAIPVRKPIDLSSGTDLKKYEGTYYLSNDFALRIKARDGKLMAKATGQDEFRIYPESAIRWFYSVVEADIEFKMNDKGEVESLVLYQNGLEMPASRTRPPALEAQTKQRQEIKLDPAKLAAFVGEYKLAPDFIITITTADGKLYAQATGQERFPVYPSSETTFFYKVVEAVIQFVSDDKGAVQKLILHQGGLALPAPKMK